MAISPHTPPGTPLVVVRTCTTWDEIETLFHPRWRTTAQEMWFSGQLETMQDQGVGLGRRVTLAAIEPSEVTNDGFVVRLVETQGSYHLTAFDIAILPSCLTDLLTSKPADIYVDLPCDC